MTYAEVTQFGNSGQIHFRETADPVVSDGQLAGWLRPGKHLGAIAESVTFTLGVPDLSRA